MITESNKLKSTYMRYLFYILMIGAFVALSVWVFLKNIMLAIRGKKRQMRWNPMEAFDPMIREDIYW